MIGFSITKNQTTQDFEIVLSCRHKATVVQANIKTREKAEEALRGWRRLARADAENLGYPRPSGMPWDR